MATEKTPTTSAPVPPTQQRVYVEIPKAGPGQGYRAPKNEDRPLLTTLSRIATVALCLSIPGATGLIFIMIYLYDPNARAKFLWIWIPLTLFIMIVSLLLAYGVACEALGIAREDGRRARP
ncbi:MAG: hypothetical protein IVW57_13840 [Ktedonobacterales bacterium]|nr:hypothetical protein [Ktedonobacterales bacterium]